MCVISVSNISIKTNFKQITSHKVRIKISKGAGMIRAEIGLKIDKSQMKRIAFVVS